MQGGKKCFRTDFCSGIVRNIKQGVLFSEIQLAAGNWRLAAGNWRLAAGNWRLAASNWRLATGNWRLAAGCWQLAAGSWLMVPTLQRFFIPI